MDGAMVQGSSGQGRMMASDEERALKRHKTDNGSPTGQKTCHST